MILIDTHCHLYLKQFDYDREQAIGRAIQNGVQKIFLPAVDSETHAKLIELAERPVPDSGFKFYSMMGVHPCSITADYDKELKMALDYLNSGKKFYAVGEIGLDYYWDMTFKEQQIAAFEIQIDWAIERNLPIVIHSRQSTGDCIKSVQKFAGKVRGIFHCFSGTIEEARQIVDLGFYMGIGGVATYKNGGLKEMLPAIGLQNMVLETDAPYLAPVPYRGKRNEPSYLKAIAETMATALNISVEEVAETTTKNALTVFQLNS